MHVLEIDMGPIRLQRNLTLAALLVVSLWLASASIGTYMAWESASEIDRSTRVMRLFAPAGFLLLFAWLANASVLACRNPPRIVITGTTLALKQPGIPAILIKKRNCVAFEPARRSFRFRDGTEFPLFDLRLPGQNVQALTRFIFAHWWPELLQDELNAERNAGRSRPSGQFRALIGLILLGVVAFACLMLLLSARLSPGTFLFMVTGAFILFLLAYFVPKVCVELETEPKTYLLDLTNAVAMEKEG